MTTERFAPKQSVALPHTHPESRGLAIRQARDWSLSLSQLYGEIVAGKIRGLSVKHTCRVLGISRSKLYSEIAAGKIKVRKCGKKTIVDAVSIDAYWDALPEGTSKGA